MPTERVWDEFCFGLRFVPIVTRFVLLATDHKTWRRHWFNILWSEVTSSGPPVLWSVCYLTLLCLQLILIKIKTRLTGNSCHASVAAIVKHLTTDPETEEYCKDLTRMTKVVLKADNENQLLDVCTKFDANGIKYHLWVEQPENINVCVATVPRDREVLKPLLTHLKLFKWFQLINFLNWFFKIKLIIFDSIIWLIFK